MIEVYKLIRKLNKKINKMANSITELIEQAKGLGAKADALQTSLDLEQAAIKAALESQKEANIQLQAAIADLQAIVANGGTEAQRAELATALNAVSTKMTAATTDLESTIP